MGAGTEIFIIHYSQWCPMLTHRRHAQAINSPIYSSSPTPLRSALSRRLLYYDKTTKAGNVLRRLTTSSRPRARAGRVAEGSGQKSSSFQVMSFHCFAWKYRRLVSLHPLNELSRNLKVALMWHSELLWLYARAAPEPSYLSWQCSENGLGKKLSPRWKGREAF